MFKSSMTRKEKPNCHVSSLTIRSFSTSFNLTAQEVVLRREQSVGQETGRASGCSVSRLMPRTLIDAHLAYENTRGRCKGVKVSR